MSRDSLYIEYNNLKKDLDGLSPKLELYQKIKSKMDAISEQLGNQTGKILKRHEEINLKEQFISTKSKKKRKKTEEEKKQSEINKIYYGFPTEEEIEKRKKERGGLTVKEARKIRLDAKKIIVSIGNILTESEISRVVNMNRQERVNYIASKRLKLKNINIEF